MTTASIAANRFGYGLKAGDRVPADPRSWLKEQLNRYRPENPSFDGLAGRAEVGAELADNVAMIRERRKAGEDANQKMARSDSRAHYAAQVDARFSSAVLSDTPFVERLVHFWANHFAVSADKLETIGFGGLLEFEAVRPHVLGRFQDMLLAVERHPAMLLYLDQAQSIGPNSKVGLRVAARGGKQGGLNENLAREILELHTLGVRSVYTQQDVTEFARALTGWTVSGIARGPAARAIGAGGPSGDFVFAPSLHEPGPRKIIGKSYAGSGETQAIHILSDLALHPATARHIATKLARHFAGDDPPVALVQRLERRFLESRGDLKSVYAVLIEAPEIWSIPSAKFKTPWDWLVSAHRALGMAPSRQAANLLNQLGQAVWRPGSPAGFDDVAASWAGPDALFRRIEAAERLATRAAISNPSALAVSLFPGVLSAATATAISRAESPVQGTSLLLVSPEFLRR